MKRAAKRRPVATITTIEGQRHYTPRPGQSPADYAAERAALVSDRWARALTNFTAGQDERAKGRADHEHNWIGWARPAVLRDSLGAVISSRRAVGPAADVVVQRLHGTDQPITPGWWRTCQTCPAEEWSSATGEADPVANSPKNAPRLDGLITQPQPESHPRWQTVGRKKSAPIFYAGRCPVCRCSRLHLDDGWAEASLLGWTVGVCWR